MNETSATALQPPAPAKDGIAGFSQRVLRYFLTFLQTDFKRTQAPRRRIQLKSDAGFRTAIPLRKYTSLYTAIWKFVTAAPPGVLQFRIPPGKYTAPISPTLRDLIRQHTNDIDPTSPERISAELIVYAKANRIKAVDEPEKFVDAVQIQFVELVGQKLIQPLLSLLDGPFRSQAYSAIESIYEVEADLTDTVTARVLENLPIAVNTLIVRGDPAPMEAVLKEFLSIEGVRERILGFFDDFATSDVFQELRDLQHTLRSSEAQSFYLYLCDIRFGSASFPLFYISADFSFDDERKDYLLDFDPHLYVNKQAIDWILQERAGEAATVPVSPVQDRIVYLGEASFVDEMVRVMNRLIPSFDLANGIDLTRPILQQESSPTLKLSNAAYFAIFDKSDEALLNDYEGLLIAFEQEQSGAARMFENIIRGFITENPVSVRDAVDDAWAAMAVPERLVATSPIPVNEEQRKILAALADPNCRYISVQGPPGTGKSHTITCIAFDCILSGKNILVLSDKVEALDVVQDKLESALQRVRHGDDDFPNPILRLGKSGNTYTRLVSPSAREKIKTHHAAAKSHAERIELETAAVRSSLKHDITRTIEIYSGVTLSELDVLHDLEREIDAARPGLALALQSPAKPAAIAELAAAVQKVDAVALIGQITGRIECEADAGTLTGVMSRLAAWKAAGELKDLHGKAGALAVFSTLEAEHHPVLMNFLAEYEALRMPVFGYLFRGGKLAALNLRVGSTLPCPDPNDLHRRLPDLKAALATLGRLRDVLTQWKIPQQTGFAYRLLRDGVADRTGVADMADVLAAFQLGVMGGRDGYRLAYGGDGFASLDELLRFVLNASRYAVMWHRIGAMLESVPTTDYVGTKSRLEQLDTARMTREIDRRFIEFVQEKAATAKEFGGIIKAKAKFPEDEFHHLSDAFPCIISGVRDYAEYVPLKQALFDVVVIDEASQVSVAQALPALLRAKKVVVFGDQKQFSNVKSAQASNLANTAHLTDIEAYFRANVSSAATKLERLKHFDVKKSILEFFDLISNYQTMLRKHFRGYAELISFSSKTFYDGQLQAIKIRSAPIHEVIRFEVLDGADNGGRGKNTNRAEVDFILSELRRMIDDGEEMSVGIITPFREQVKLLNDVLYRDAYGERFDSELKLKVMTFDTCQGEERDLIIFSMVATDKHDALNYIFPVSLNKEDIDRVEEALKVQRLNVGFSRAKEAFLFVLSKPVEDFKGSIGRVLMHYKTLLEHRALPAADETDPASPMERRVLDWIGKTAFYQMNSEKIEVVAQFPIGDYLRQLDPFYQHPAYRTDFLLRYYDGQTTANVVLEYDGFSEHFTDHGKIHSGNWDQYYRPEDIERQLVLESYGYKFLRINRFNLGRDPVETLSKRLYDLIKVASEQSGESQVVARVKADAESLLVGDKKTCPRCGQIRDLQEYWDAALKSGNGGYGRNCMACKNAAKPSGTKRSRAGKMRYGRRQY